MTALDEIWVGAAARLGIEVLRRGEAYVHWDGTRLHLCDDEHLDADDTVAQLVLHEICHWLTEGPGARRLPDWGLDNTSDRDAVREEAAVRLQAHLTGAWGLRGALFPTTIVRPFFESLPADALASPDESARIARASALAAAREPFRDVLAEALRESARALGKTWHRGGRPVGEHPCGSCAWRSDGGLCRASARRIFVDADEPGCTRWQGALDCGACGACCREGYDSVTVGRAERVVRRHPLLVVDRGSYVELRREEGRCAALEGDYRCAIYDHRPRCCRDLAVGGRHCLDARRRVGLSS